MLRYRTVAQISLVLSILNLVLAAPITVQRIPETRGEETVVAEDVASPLSSPDEMASPHLSPGVMASLHSSPDTMESLQDPPSPSGSTSSGYSYDLPLSSDPKPDPLARYVWLMDRPPRLNLNPPVSLHDSAVPYPSSSGLPEIQLPESLPVDGPASPHPPSPGLSEIQYPEWVHELAPEMPPDSHLPESLDGSASPHPSSPGLSEIQFPGWVQELAPEEMPQSPQSTGSDRATTEAATYSSSDGFTASHHPSSLSSIDPYPWSDEWFPTPYSSVSDGSLSTYYSSALDGFAPTHDLTSMPSHHSMSEALVPSQRPTSDGPPPSETPPDSEKFFNKNTMKKIKMVAGVAIVGGAIASIVGSHIKHHKHRDGQDT